ncbi:interferon gamma receptor 1 isoform X2 [Larus michahellis]|uniref:interferon gamma receptor 1 isoform X2 n=1 Tax=Larus michahellis TaxID=119627 RepID=UPI003D9B5326
MQVLRALLTFAVVAAGRSEASRGEQPPAVPSPTGIQVTSENFKTTLHWQYPSTSETPHFIVEIKPYNLGSYKIVSTCVNISAHFCDVSREIDDPFASHWLRVKAVVGSQQSDYVETDEFILQKRGKIGPPKLNLSRHGDKIMVDVYHPAFPSVELLPWMEETYLQLKYMVTFWDKKNQSKEVFPGDNCTMYKCSLNIPITAPGSTYCVSAKGSFYDDLMFGAPSEENCIYVPLKQTLSTQYIFIPCVVVILSLSIMLTVCCGCKKLRKKNIKLPKSLLEEASRLQALVLLGNFNHPDFSWKNSMVSCRQSRTLVECMEGNNLSQVIDNPIRGAVILDLMVTNVSELIGDINIGGSLGCSDHALVEFAVLKDMGQAKSKVRTLNFRKANFQLFKESVKRTPWETALWGKRAEQS